ncbi:TetR/AcrR family transcriptional regulator [Streptomyces sp. ME01-24h]|nr:TetR/AcrR family transcriptional regulator [Streptomyces sp. ME19-03-3]MDX3352846.1 TetR/AcrR family transcriptional regulator [Streptomyces sp. ME01-24h]
MDERATTRERIVSAAAALLAEGGRDAVSTRSVSKAAAVQPPTIYRQFGDMRGLLDAVAADGFAGYLHRKTDRVRAADPVEDLRRGWDLHIEFGVAHPEIYQLMFGQPRPGAQPAAVRESFNVLRGLVTRVAEAGRLSVDVERAMLMIHAAGCGVVLTLIATLPEDRDPELSSRTREAVFAAITTEETDESAGDAAEEERRTITRTVAFKAVLPEVAEILTPGERILLNELLDRITQSA